MLRDVCLWNCANNFNRGVSQSQAQSLAEKFLSETLR